MKRPRPGGFCCYCKRILTPALPERSNSLTFDHIVARVHGGKAKVPCCRKCNNLKGAIDMGGWWWFVRNTPRYWKTFDTTEQVASVIREHRFNLAMHARIVLGPSTTPTNPNAASDGAALLPLPSEERALRDRAAAGEGAAMVLPNVQPIPASHAGGDSRGRDGGDWS
jgi:hypothetical protein